MTGRRGRPSCCPVAVLREAVDLRLRGATLVEIAGHFNAAGVPTPGGGVRWYASHVSRLLRTRTGEEALAAAGRRAS